jgi:gluconolactonase
MKHFLLALVILPAVLQRSALPPDTAVKPVKIAEVPGYCEGVVFDRAGLAYISDTNHGTIYRVSPAGETTVWAKTPAPNGHKILKDGTHLVCDKGAVLHLDAEGKRLADASNECEGKPLRVPNDLTIDPKGGFYFTDPGGSSLKNPIGTVHYVDPQGKTHLVAEGLAFPNGIVLRPDGKTLLVGESQQNRILAYEVTAPGKVGARRVLATLPTKQGDQIANEPDGMALDEDGNLYIAHYGMHTVQVLDPEGKLLRSYPGGNLTTSNVAFAGPQMDRLYITGALTDEKMSKGALWRLDLGGVRGLRLLPVEGER